MDREQLAAEAGLVHIADEAPGIGRIGRGSGFTYRHSDASPVDDATRQRIRELAVPPAWRRVWISEDPLGHIQAVGYDAKGRKQYVYHPIWEEVRAEVKFSRMGQFGQALGRLRPAIDADLRLPGLPRRRVVALAVAVLDRTLIRICDRRYAEENDSYGLTTLTDDHVEVNGSHVVLGFSGKGGSDHQVAFRDRRLAGLIGRCTALSGDTLFSYETDQGLMAVTAADVNGYVAAMARGPFTAKDFRTWGASSCVVGELSTEDQPTEAAVLRAIDTAAERLGNTRAVLRGSYLHPAVPEAFLDGGLSLAWRRSRTGRWLDRSESALNRVLASRRSDEP